LRRLKLSLLLLLLLLPLLLLLLPLCLQTLCINLPRHELMPLLMLRTKQRLVLT